MYYIACGLRTVTASILGCVETVPKTEIGVVRHTLLVQTRPDAAGEDEGHQRIFFDHAQDRRFFWLFPDIRGTQFPFFHCEGARSLSHEVKS